MSYVVRRTCTMIREKSDYRERVEPSLPMSEFRDRPAYVLLGDPGMGKTTAFEEECEAFGDEAEKISARDFLSLDMDNHPEWREKVLFIDGLDEVRAGTSDARTPMNQLYGRLDSLRPPRFRISCREADWLGDNDRSRLETVSPNSNVLMLRLNPLTEADIGELLGANPRVSNPEVFIREAQQRGLDGLLSNPQTLKMLAEVVGNGPTWPEGRFDTFELACKQMALEHNEEHVIGEPTPSVEKLLDATGRLCALHLIAGFAGYTVHREPTSGDYPPVDICDYEPNSTLRAALSTRLFAGVGEGCFTPVHRHIAEFLGARHLARLIEDGLPARRIIALIAQYGSVVTELRGLSAWLAAHSQEARRVLIGGDPIGVGLYGDIRDFSSEDKYRLLRSLNREVVGVGYTQGARAAFGPLVAEEMESILHNLLADDRRDYDHQLAVEFLLHVMGHGKPLPGLQGSLFDVVRDDRRWPRVTRAALKTSIQWAADNPDSTKEHKRLLEDIHSGHLDDPDSELLGMLLTHLYPEEVSPSKVWVFLSREPRSNLIGMYVAFWDHFLLEKSSDDDVAVLLDQLHEGMPDRAIQLDGHNLSDVPMKLLVRGLVAHGDTITTERLYDWLSACSHEDMRSYGYVRNVPPEVKEWLEERPGTQKAILLEGLSRHPDTHSFIYSASTVWGCLFGSNLPSDFGLWCLDRAVELDGEHPQVAQSLLRLAVNCHLERSGNEGLSRSVLLERTLGHPKLTSELATLLEPPVNRPLEDRRRMMEKYEEEDRRRRQQWIDYVSSNVDDLRENRGSPTVLFKIAEAYFGTGGDGDRDSSPVERVNELLGNQEELLEASLAGLTGVMWRDDLPSADEVTRLYTANRSPYLALPALAGMIEMEQRDPLKLNSLNEEQLKTALTFYFTRSTGSGEGAEWYRSLVEKSQKLVEDVLIRDATSAIRAGKEHVPGLYHLAEYTDGHGQVAREGSLKLLQAFPVRCKRSQLGVLDNLLWIAARNADLMALDILIERKVSLKSMTVSQRVRWLAAGTVISPDKYGNCLEEYAEGRDVRIRELGAFFSPSFRVQDPIRRLCADNLRRFIQLVGSSFGPMTPDGWITPAIKASEIVDRMIQWLEALDEESSLQSLEALRSIPELGPWHIQLEGAIGRRRKADRDAAFRHPTVEQVCQTLAGSVPSNADDLAALLVDRLEEILLRIRTGNTNDWRQYWNEDLYRHPSESKHEDSCRDAILSDLRAILPDGVDAQPEGRYVSDKRSDIRVAFREFNVPIEAKKNSHRDLWSAMRDQLIAKYTSDAATSGYGIYLVFWFGEESSQPPPQGGRPRTAEELRQRLEHSLSTEEARKISVCVIDVSQPGVSSTPLGTQPAA